MPFQITIVAAPKARATAATVRDVALFEAAFIAVVLVNHLQFSALPVIGFALAGVA